MCAGQLRVSGDVARSLGPPSVEYMSVDVLAEVNAAGWFNDNQKLYQMSFYACFFAARTALTQFLPTLSHGEYCPRCANVETSIDSGAGVTAI